MPHTKKNRRWMLPLALAVLAGGSVSAIAIFLSVTGALVALSIVLAPLCWMLATRYGRLHRDAPTSIEMMGSNYEAIISLLSGALGLQDSVTLSNATRVSTISAIVASQMGLRGDDVRLIEKAAILHDIGKLGIAEDVLGSRGALSDRDWTEMRRHPQFGFEILSAIESLEDCAEIVWAHHERFDGQGYPRGLKGDDIPVGARIFAVVDAYVAMTSGRPYRKTMSHAMAVREIIRNSLTQFDPQVVDAFTTADRLGLLTGVPVPAEPRRASAKPVAAEA
ncbi:MAG: HD-GYP domain-containing protein [Dehalococcoidia bacterium]